MTTPGALPLPATTEDDSGRVRLGSASVLVTGAAGFIGSHVCEALCKLGARVVAADPSLADGCENLVTVQDTVEMVPTRLSTRLMRSLLDRVGFDYVFHFAGSADPRASRRAPVKDLEANCALTLSLLEASRRAARVPAVLVASSAAVYGHSRSLPLDESAPTEPMSPYGASKLASEMYAGLFSRQFGVPTASMRIFSAYGPRLRRQVVHDILARLIQDPSSLTIRTTGEETRDFVFIDDIVKAAITIASFAPLQGEAYNVGTGTETSVRALAALAVGQVAAECKVTFEGHTDTVGPLRWRADARRLRRLGWTPTVPMHEGIAQTAAWLRHDRFGRHPVFD